ncbi:FMN-binding negative transcriptional regulator [Flavobacterium sp.]|uniref:FMN-binding negative transcriptional regulator n=1 Tax=Flavobacterium sp. TaxID=239 RepID=UPI002625AD65|nr:FMN-binding negative transcriptional regulator [Flavobacterium sp.]
MYDLPHHKEHNEKEITDFINQYPFAFITGCDAAHQPIVTQLPLFPEEKDGKKILRGHLMKNTDHHLAFMSNERVLVVFTGKSTYVSGTWYSNPYMASTWNYMSVHIKGSIRFLDDHALEEVLRLTSLHFENNNENSTTVYDNLPMAFKQRVMGAIVAFEIEVVEIDTVFKLSQDRDEKSYQNIIAQLKLGDHDGQVIASEMERRFDNVFKNRQ